MRLRCSKEFSREETAIAAEHNGGSEGITGIYIIPAGAPSLIKRRRLLAVIEPS